MGFFKRIGKYSFTAINITKKSSTILKIEEGDIEDLFPNLVDLIDENQSHLIDILKLANIPIEEGEELFNEIYDNTRDGLYDVLSGRNSMYRVMDINCQELKNKVKHQNRLDLGYHWSWTPQAQFGGCMIEASPTMLRDIDINGTFIANLMNLGNEDEIQLNLYGGVIELYLHKICDIKQIKNDYEITNCQKINKIINFK